MASLFRVICGGTQSLLLLEKTFFVTGLVFLFLGSVSPFTWVWFGPPMFSCSLFIFFLINFRCVVDDW